MDASLNFCKTTPLVSEAWLSIDESLNLLPQNSGQGFEIQDKMSQEMKPLKKVHPLGEPLLGMPQKNASCLHEPKCVF